MKFWLGVFAVWAVPSAMWTTYAAIHGRVIFDDPGWGDVIAIVPPVLYGALILAVLWFLDRWPKAKG